MSTPKHTPEPWRTNGIWIDAGTSATVAYCRNGNPNDADNAARAVQCVNACAGMDDPAAEIARLREIERVARQVREAVAPPLRPGSVAVDAAAFDVMWRALLTPKEP